jgi:hypothetical protein
MLSIRDYRAWVQESIYTHPLRASLLIGIQIAAPASLVPLVLAPSGAKIPTIALFFVSGVLVLGPLIVYLARRDRQRGKQ